MKQKQIFLAVGVGLALWYFTAQSKRFDIGSAAVTGAKLTGSGIRLNISLPVINRSDFDIPITGFLGQLLFRGSQVGTIQQVASVTLPARSQSAIQFTTTISFLGALGPLLPLLNSLAKKYIGVSLPGVVVDPNAPLPALSDLRIMGTLYVNAVAVDINQSLTA